MVFFHIFAVFSTFLNIRSSCLSFKKVSLNSSIVITLLFTFGVGSTKSQEICRTDISVTGFKRLSDLTEAMKNDFFAYISGAFMPGPHVYRLCPRTTFHLDENNDGEFSYIYPLLNGTQIICGSSGEGSDNCIIKGGDIQVLLRNSVAEDYVRKETEFYGVTFDSSNGLSIAAWDSPQTKATFVDCHWRKNTGQGVIQNIFVPYTKAPSPTQAPTVQSNKPITNPGSKTGNDKDKKQSKNDRALRLSQFENFPSNRFPQNAATIMKSPKTQRLPADNIKTGRNSDKNKHQIYSSFFNEQAHYNAFKSDNENLISSSSSMERALASKSRHLESNTAMEIELIGCSITETVAGDGYFFSLINKGGSMRIKDTVFHKNQNTCNIISTGGSVSLDGAYFHKNNLMYNVAIYDGGKLDVNECVFEMNKANSEIITVDENNNTDVSSEFSLQKSCFLRGNYMYSHVYLHPNSQISTNENNYANNTDPGLCNLFNEDPLSSCLSSNNESMCVGICFQFDDVQSCPISTTLTTQSPTTSPAPSYSSSTLLPVQYKDDDFSMNAGNNKNSGDTLKNLQDLGQKSGFSSGMKEIIVGTLFVVFTVLVVSTFVIYRRIYGREKGAIDTKLFRQNSNIT